MIIRRFCILFAVILCVCTQSVFASKDSCAAPANCETAIACGIYQNLDKITPKYTLDDIVADAIFFNIESVCLNFNFEHGWKDVNVGDGLSINWKKVKTIVMDKVNYDPNSKNFTFLVTENAWYALGGTATGIAIGSIVVVGAAVCAIVTFGACAAVGLGASGASLVTIGATTMAIGTTAVAVSGAAATAITAQQIAIAANKLKVKKTWSDWDGCVNITDNGKTSTISDLFTTEVVRLTFPDLRGSTFAFNTGSGNLLFKDAALFTMTAAQKNGIMQRVSSIKDKGACDWHAWELYLYPVRVFLKDIDEKGQWVFDMRVENDSVLLDK